MVVDGKPELRRRRTPMMASFHRCTSKTKFLPFFRSKALPLAVVLLQFSVNDGFSAVGETYSSLTGRLGYPSQIGTNLEYQGVISARFLTNGIVIDVFLSSNRVVVERFYPDTCNCTLPNHLQPSHVCLDANSVADLMYSYSSSNNWKRINDTIDADMMIVYECFSPPLFCVTDLNMSSNIYRITMFSTAVHNSMRQFAISGATGSRKGNSYNEKHEAGSPKNAGGALIRPPSAADEIAKTITPYPVQGMHVGQTLAAFAANCVKTQMPYTEDSDGKKRVRSVPLVGYAPLCLVTLAEDYISKLTFLFIDEAMSGKSNVVDLYNDIQGLLSRRFGQPSASVKDVGLKHRVLGGMPDSAQIKDGIKSGAMKIYSTWTLKGIIVRCGIEEVSTGDICVCVTYWSDALERLRQEIRSKEF